MHLLIAPNAFKNSLTADEAAKAIAEGFLLSNLDCTCECFAIGDGGDGTAELIIKKCRGQVQSTEVNDALGRKINATYGLINDGKTAVIEMANASGLRLLKHEELNPFVATSYGTGEQIKAALNKGAEKIIIGMGGSATVDGGVGILKALGILFLDEDGNELNNLPGSLLNLAKVDVTNLDVRVLQTEITVLCDVDNLLLGPNGSSAVFGPQKGATEEGVKRLDTCLGRLSDVAMKETGKDMSAIKYGGTAGGAAAGLFAFLNAKLVNGIDHFLELTNFEQSLKKSNLVITGEGSIDEQTLLGKGPFGVAASAKKMNLPVIALAGKVPLQNNEALQQYFDGLLAIGNQPCSLPDALTHTAENLSRTARQLGNLLAIRNL